MVSPILQCFFSFFHPPIGLVLVLVVLVLVRTDKTNEAIPFSHATTPVVERLHFGKLGRAALPSVGTVGTEKLFVFYFVLCCAHGMRRLPGAAVSLWLTVGLLSRIALAQVSRSAVSCNQRTGEVARNAASKRHSVRVQCISLREVQRTVRRNARLRVQVFFVWPSD